MEKTVTVRWNDVKQEIDGFGVSQADWSGAIYELSEPVRSKIMDLLFDQEKGIGASVFRGEIFADFNPAPGEYDFNERFDQVWVMQQAEKRGVDKIIATNWSPPAWMKTNNSTTHGGYLKLEYYGDYARLLSGFIKEYRQQFGIDLYAISMCNEPNSMKFLSWDSCQWNSTNIQVFLRDYLKQEMTAQGVEDTKVIAAEPSWWSEKLTKDALNDPDACERIDIVAAHNYPVPIVNRELRTKPFQLAVDKGKRVWMTEVSQVDSYDTGMTSGLKFAKQIHHFMTKADVNAWLYWTGAIPGDNDEGLINIYKDTDTYQLTKRYYAFGNYSKFVRPGCVRIGTEDRPMKDVYLSAYRNPETGEFTVIAVNDHDSTAELNIVPEGFDSASLTPYITNDSLNMEQGHDIVSESGTFKVLLSSRSVVTFVGEKTI